MIFPRILAATIILGLGGCVAAPPPPPPLVALPGPNKTPEMFGQDDAACRGVVSPPATAAGDAQPPATPAQQYLACMGSKGNVIEPLPLQAAYYPYYPGYPVYAPVGFYSPFIYGGFFGFGGYRYGGFYGHHGFYGRR